MYIELSAQEIAADLVDGAGPDNFAGQDEVGGRPPVHALLAHVDPGHLAHLLLAYVADDPALLGVDPADQAGQDDQKPADVTNASLYQD